MEVETPTIATTLESVSKAIAEKPLRPSTESSDPKIGEAKQRWLDLSRRIGRRYEDCTLANYKVSSPVQREAVEAVRKFCENMPEHIRTGRNAILFGPVGTGKDHLLVAMLKSAIRDGGASCHWCNGADLYGELRDLIDKEGSESSQLRKYIEPAVLAISDPLPPLIGKNESADKLGQLTSFQAQMLLRIVDARYRQCRATWMTMNVLNGQEAEDRLGVQLVDRLRDDNALRVFCNWQSFRKGGLT